MEVKDDGRQVPVWILERIFKVAWRALDDYYEGKQSKQIAEGICYNVTATLRDLIEKK